MALRILYKSGGSDAGIPLDRPLLSIGRAAECDLSLRHGSVSRRHAEIRQERGGWWVTDLGSTNGTRLNGTESLRRALRHGDVIQVGEIELSVVDDDAPSASVILSTAPPTSMGQTVFRSTVDFANLVRPQTPTGPGAQPRAEDLARLVPILSESSQAILAGGSLDEIFGRILGVIFERLPVDRGFIMLLDETTNELVPRAARSRNAQAPGSLQFSRTIAEKVMREKVAVLTRDAQTDDRFAAGMSLVGLGIRSAMAAPLWNGDAVSGLICLDTTNQAQAFGAFDLDLLSALGHHLAVAVEQSRLNQLALEKERLDRELAVARQIQMGTLPKRVPVVPGYDLAGMSRPAEETGGDTYDLIPLPDGRVMLLLADATGHGVGPALSATQVRSMLRVAMRLGATLDDTFRHINDQLEADSADNRLVSAFLGVLDSGDHHVRYHSGGHGPILHYHAATGNCDRHSATTVPMGSFPVRRLKPPQDLPLEPGDILALITDGVFEAANPAEEMFGVPRTEEILRDKHNRPMAEVARALLASVDTHAPGRQADDITIVLVRRLPAAESPMAPGDPETTSGSPSAPSA